MREYLYIYFSRVQLKKSFNYFFYAMQKLDNLLAAFQELSLEDKREKVLKILASAPQDETTLWIKALIEENPDAFDDETYVEIYMNVMTLALGI